MPLNADMKLGKKEYVFDSNTLKMASFIKQDAISVPPRFNFDQYRKAFPNNLWGNDEYGDCVFAARANSQLRFERIEQRVTIPIQDETVIDLYKELTGCVEPGDANDSGFVILYAMRQWRKQGWKVGKRNYTVFAYGEVDPLHHTQVKQTIYALQGAHFGFALPVAVQGKTSWTYNGEGGPDWEPGSWGGHCVYAKGYDENGVIVKTWGEDVHVNWKFVDKFSDECWGVVDNADSWRAKQTVDVQKLNSELREITGSVNP